MTTTDRNGNFIGSINVTDYDVRDFSKYGVSSYVSKSETTESVYVTYYLGDKSITCRFSNHENNAVKFGDQLNGYICSDLEILHRLGLAKRTFVPKTYKSINSRQVKKNDLHLYPEADVTIKELYDLPVGSDISKYTGKLSKGSNYLILGTEVQQFNETRIGFGGIPENIGTFKYEMI